MWNVSLEDASCIKLNSTNTVPKRSCTTFFDTMELSPGVEESFPYPLSITRDAFAENADFDPDYFLFKNHRFTSLETLLTDLSDLSKALNRDLLDLVNDEYSNFIQLGQSISCGLELIDNVTQEVGKFNKSVDQTVTSLSLSSTTAHYVLKHKKRLNILKNKTKLILLLHEQCASFETLLGLDVDQGATEDLLDKLNTLATLYFSVIKIFSVLMEANTILDGANASNSKASTAISALSNLNERISAGPLPSPSSVTGSEYMCGFFDKSIKTRVVSIKFEFKLYMTELTTLAKKDTKKYSSLLLQLLQISRITGHTLHLFTKES